MLRTALIVLSGIFLLICLGLLAAGVGGPATLFVWLGVQALIVVVAIIAERGRYQGPTSSTHGWARTGERFQDPTTGKWLEVEFNAATGERRYVETKTV